MSWDNRRPADAKYRTKEHRAEREKWKRYLAKHGAVECAQPECVMSSRTITASEVWHLGHDESGTRYIGPVHATCNTRDGAIRGNRMSGQALGMDRWAL